MLKLKCGNIFKLRNVAKPYTFLRKAGFTHAIARKITGNEVYSIRMADLYDLCRILNCTPNDLVEFEPKDEPKEHALYGLVRRDVIVDYNKTIKTLSIEKLRNLEQYLEELRQPVNDQVEE